MSASGRSLSIAVLGAVLVLSAFAPMASAYVLSPEAATACPACTTEADQAQAAELTEGLSIDGIQASTFGSTTALAEDAAATSTGAARGVGFLSSTLLDPVSVEALYASSLGGGGLVVGAFATGFTVGTAGRALVMHLFGGSDDSPTQVDDRNWTNVRWVLCRDSPCVTAVPSSAWSSPVIPRGSMYAVFGGGWGSSFNVSWEGTYGYSDCYGSTPPAAPCQQNYYGAYGPQAGDLPGARAVTVYGVGTTERPGHVFVRQVQDLLDPAQPATVVSTNNVSGAWFGSVSQAPPRSADDLLSKLDAAITANPGLGAWVQAQLDAHPADAPDTPFRKVVEKWQKHGDELGFDDLMDYWREADRIVKAARDGHPDIRQCTRFDDKEILWDASNGRLVIVNPDGSIETLFLRDDEGAYWQSECARIS